MKSVKCELIVLHKDEAEKMDEIAEMEVGDLLGVGFGLITLVIGYAIGLQLLGDTQEDMTPNSTEWNATQQGKEAIALVPKKLKIIVTVIIASVLIGLLVRHLWRSYMG